MSSDEKKNWGTIFLDAARESSLSKLDAMQAASRQQQWNQKTQQDYLERVRQKAIDRAREILGEAYTERQNVLDEAERDAERIRNEAKAAYASADEIRNQTQDLRHSIQAEFDNATHIREGAKEEGFQVGLAAAQEELNNFRAAMGTSVAGILRAIEAQCMNIFENWRTELVDLLKVCVEKGTGLALSERHDAILRKMLLEAVRNLDDRRMVTLRVHPDDEEVVADLFAAAKERNPDLGHWRIAPDASLELGDIVAESHTGTVDSRLHLYREMVDNVLRHLALPPSVVDEEAKVSVNNNLEDVIQRVMSITPAAPESPPQADAPKESVAAQNTAQEPEADEVLQDYVQQAQQENQALLEDILTEQPQGTMHEPFVAEQTPNFEPQAAEHAEDLENFENSPAWEDSVTDNDAEAESKEREDLEDMLFSDAEEMSDNLDQNFESQDFQAVESTETEPQAEPTPKASAQPYSEPSMEELEDELLPVDFEADGMDNLNGENFEFGEFLDEEPHDNTQLDALPEGSFHADNNAYNANNTTNDDDDIVYNLGTPYGSLDDFDLDDVPGSKLNRSLDDTPDVIDLTNPIVKGRA